MSSRRLNLSSSDITNRFTQRNPSARNESLEEDMISDRNQRRNRNRVVPINTKDEEQNSGTQYKDIETQRSVTSQAIDMLVDDSQPDHEVEKQFKTQWRLIRNTVRGASALRRGGASALRRGNTRRTADLHSSVGPTSRNEHAIVPLNEDVHSEVEEKELDAIDRGWRHPEKMRCVLSCMLIAMRVLNYVLFVTGAAIILVAWLITRISDSPQVGTFIMGFGMFVVGVSVLLGPFFCCCCGSSNYTCSHKIEGCLAVSYVLVVFVIFVCTTGFAGFVLSGELNDQETAYHFLFGYRDNITATQVFKPLQSAGIKVDPPAMTQWLALVAFVVLPLMTSALGAMYSICLFRSYAIKAQGDLKRDIARRERDLRRREEATRQTRESELDNRPTSPPREAPDISVITSVVEAQVKDAVQAANMINQQHSLTELHKVKAEMTTQAKVELQAAIAKEHSVTEKETQKVKHLNEELEIMSERLKTLERSASQKSMNSDGYNEDDYNGEGYGGDDYDGEGHGGDELSKFDASVELEQSSGAPEEQLFPSVTKATCILPEQVYKDPEPEPEQVFEDPEPEPEPEPEVKKPAPAPAPARRASVQEQKLCVVCWDSPKNALLMPCKHLATCYECATTLNGKGVRSLQECPMCRVNIFEVVKIFAS